MSSNRSAGSRRARLALGALAVCLTLGLAAPALAADEAIGGVHEVRDGDERTPVGGVRVEVFLDDEPVGEATSTDDGVWSVPVPGPGVYRVVLDVDNLPDGVAPTDPDRVELGNVDVRSGQAKVVRFQLGSGRSGGGVGLERVLETLVVGLKYGAIIALSSIGLSMIYGLTGLVNFSHGELVTLGAVLAWWFNASVGWHIAVAAVPAVLIMAAFGGAQERYLWLPLRRRRSGDIALIVVSIGFSFVLRYGLILVPFGGMPRSYRQYAIQRPVEIFGLSILPKDIFVIVASLVILTVIGVALQRTRLGTAMRAVADNPDLSRSSGIDVDRVILVTWVLGSGLAALGGVFFGLAEVVEWQMGFRLLLMIFAAIVLGGLGSAYGAMLGGFVVGILVETSTLFLSVELKTVTAMVILIAMLLVRPQGLLGQRERIG